MNDSVAIIGGGFSGCMVAAHLLRKARHPFQVVIFEPRADLGKGAAFSTAFDGHLLNVTAAKMSALPEKPSHFVEWLRLQGRETRDDEFVPRKLYGEYVAAILNEAKQGAAPDVTLEHITEQAVDIVTVGSRLRVQITGKRTIDCRAVVLATGNEPPTDPSGLDASLSADSRYVPDPWNPIAFDRIAKSDTILLIGTSLTMMDVVLALEGRGHDGVIHALSRHGLLSTSHLNAPLSRPPFRLSSHFDPPPATARRLLRLVRDEACRAETSGGDWRDAIDALRPITTSLWQALSTDEQKRFLQRLRLYWDIHRHRAPSRVAEALRRRIAEGRIRLIAGRIHDVRPRAAALRATIQRRGARDVERLDVNFAINCTGPRRDPRQSRNRLLPDLVARGLVQVDAHALGLACNENGATIDGRGRINKTLFAIGPLRTGQLWETVAVPELRVQAAELAERIMRMAGPRTS